MPVLSLPVFIEWAARASVILAATGLVAVALRRSSAAARHLVWVLGLVTALAVPALSTALPKWELPIVKVATDRVTAADQILAAQAASLPAEAGSSGLSKSAIRPISEVGAPGFSREVQGFSRESHGASTSTILLALWALGAAVVLGRLLLGLIAVQWMSRRARVVTDGPWLALAQGLAADLGVRGVRFVQSATASMPMAWGLLRASVLMPADADEWPVHRLRVVLLHELAHVKRRDCLTHLVAQVVSAVYWFNPLAWMAVRRLRSERERACDDLVLATGTPSADYADELLDIARVTPSHRFPAMIAGASLAMAHRSQLEGRLMAILDPSVPRRGLTRARAGAAAGVFAVLLLSVASVQPWAEERAAVSALTADQPQQQSATANPAEVTDAHVTVRDGVVQDAHIKVGTRGASPVIVGDIAESVASTVADQVGGAVSGVVGGVIGGVVDGVVGGVMDGVVGGVQAVVASPNPNPNPNPSPRPEQQKGRLDPRAAAALMDALKDTDKDVRETAMQALVQMRDPRMFEPLVAALKDSSADVREQAAFGLGQLRDPRAVDPLTGVLHDASADVREQAVFALGQLRDKRSTGPLISALKDENKDVREQAAFALGQLRDAESVAPLIIALKDSNPDVREQAAFALGQIRDPRAVDGLTAAMKDGNADVRKQAAFALGQIRY